MKYVYNDGGRKSAGYKGEKVGDCVCRAITIASGKPYKEVYDFLAQQNKKQIKGKSKKRSKRTAQEGISVGRKWFKDYMKELGFIWKPMMTIGSGCKVHLKQEELPQKGNLIVRLSKHYCAVIDGVINDTYDPSRNETRCVYGYWILTKTIKKQ